MSFYFRVLEAESCYAAPVDLELTTPCLGPPYAGITGICQLKVRMEQASVFSLCGCFVLPGVELLTFSFFLLISYLITTEIWAVCLPWVTNTSLWQ